MIERNIKKFWEDRSQKSDFSDSYSITNLEENKRLQKLKIEKELEMIENTLILSKDKILLDLGSGLGFWSLYFSNKCKKVICVDFIEKMNNYLEMEVKKQNIDNIEIHTGNVVDFIPNEGIDYVFLSGVLLYLSDEMASDLAKNIYSYTNYGSKIFVRDATGVKGRFVINNKYSQVLDSSYSAIYRSKSEIINLFATNGFIPVLDNDMFDKQSLLNKWDETRLRIYLFKKN